MYKKKLKSIIFSFKKILGYFIYIIAKIIII